MGEIDLGALAAAQLRLPSRTIEGLRDLGPELTCGFETLTGAPREGAPAALVGSAGTVRFVALRREDLTPEQLEHQRALDRSWAVAQHGLADPEFRAYLEASMRRLDSGDPAPSLTREEFLALTRDLDG